MITREDVNKVRAARQLLSSHDRWCRQAIALDVNGQIVLPTEPLAVQWCAFGALERYYGPTGAMVAEELMVEMLQAWGGYRSLEELNDQLGRIAVLHLFDHFLAVYDHDQTAGEKQQLPEEELCCV
jgi:hypothetical protein